MPRILGFDGERVKDDGCLETRAYSTQTYTVQLR